MVSVAEQFLMTPKELGDRLRNLKVGETYSLTGLQRLMMSRDGLLDLAQSAKLFCHDIPGIDTVQSETQDAIIYRRVSV